MVRIENRTIFGWDNAIYVNSITTVLTISLKTGHHLKALYKLYYSPEIRECAYWNEYGALFVSLPKNRKSISSEIIQSFFQNFPTYTHCSTINFCYFPFSEENTKFSSSKMAIATIMKSWPGLIRMCKPDGSGLQSLLGVLYLPNMDTRVSLLSLSVHASLSTFDRLENQARH